MEGFVDSTVELGALVVESCSDVVKGSFSLVVFF